ncbi:hypothetical protein D3C76_1130230 [compost metagenome]
MLRPSRNSCGLFSNARLSLAIRPNAQASYTPATATPDACSWQATSGNNGPVPAITTGLGGLTTPLLICNCRPPSIITPGRVQPGNGTLRS